MILTKDILTSLGISPQGLIFCDDFPPYNPDLNSLARDLRTNGTKSEAMLWKVLKNKQTGYRFTRQKPILNYIADFYCKKLDLVVEIDGASHFTAEARLRDKERDRQMRAIGLVVVRVNDGDVRRDADKVAAYIKEQCELIKGRKDGSEVGF